MNPFQLFDVVDFILVVGHCKNRGVTVSNLKTLVCYGDAIVALDGFAVVGDSRQAIKILKCLLQFLFFLQRPDGVFLKLATNSTRRVRWYTKMGFAHLPEIPAVPLSSILPGGGFVACTRVLVVRVYPLLFVEKTAEGKNGKCF